MREKEVPPKSARIIRKRIPRVPRRRQKGGSWAVGFFGREGREG